jgi:hypothetical protein
MKGMMEVMFSNAGASIPKVLEKEKSTANTNFEEIKA